MIPEPFPARFEPYFRRYSYGRRPLPAKGIMLPCADYVQVSCPLWHFGNTLHRNVKQNQRRVLSENWPRRRFAGDAAVRVARMLADSTAGHGCRMTCRYRFKA
jgi:hypothetical protein